MERGILEIIYLLGLSIAEKA